MSDGELLRAYALEGSEAAFATLVNRYLPLVHSVARRHLSDPTLSEEVTQSVFVLLARKSRSLMGHPSIAGWLHRTSWQLAARTARSEIRRRRRESEAAFTQTSAMSLSTPDLPAPSTVLPALDAALQELPVTDRDALVQRYFLRKPLREVGAALGTSEAAAKMRIRRALDHLRVLLARRGITCSPAALASVMTHQGVTPVPASLAARVIPAATGAGGAATSSFLLLHGTLSFMNGTQLAVLVTAAALVAIVLTADSRNERSRQTYGRGDESPSVVATAANAYSTGLESRRPLKAIPNDSTETPPNLEAAKQRLLQGLSAPLPRSGLAIDLNPDVVEAMASFGRRHEELFAVLKGSFLEESFWPNRRSLIQTRTLLAMRRLDPDVPGLKPFLWEIAATDMKNHTGAVWTLGKLGLDRLELPQLIRLLDRLAAEHDEAMLWTPLPEVIQDVVFRHPASTEEHVSALLDLFHRAATPANRFTIAGALLALPGGQDPMVVEAIRSGLLGKLNLPPTGGGDAAVETAIRRAAAAGDASKLLVPDLLHVARTSDVPHHRNAAWLAIGQIQPELRTEIPELDQAINRDAQTRQIRQDVAQGFATHDDLIRALRDPATAVDAATILGETGIHSSEIVQAMMAAMEGMDAGSRDQIAAAIHKLDPQVELEQIAPDIVSNAVFAAIDVMESNPTPERDARLIRLLDEGRTFTWRTLPEVFSLTRNLAALDVATAQAFVNGLAEKDPALADRARRHIAHPAQP